MKNILMYLVISLLIVGCSQSETDQNTNTKDYTIKNELTYNAAPNIPVKVESFRNSVGEECTVVRANYDQPYGQADVDCVLVQRRKIFSAKGATMLKQHVEKVGNTNIQITEIRTTANNTCTIVHTNYEKPDSTASISCS